MSAFILGFICGAVATACLTLIVALLIRKVWERAVGNWFGW